MAEPLVSVVIPTRDRPGLVGGAVRSALEQDGVRVEVCVVDDGSSQPPAVPDDERVTLLRHEAPRGAAAARNTGIAATRGDLIAFLDDDDMWLPGKLERQVGALGDAVMIATGFELWDGDTLVTSRLPAADVNDGGLLAHPCVCPSAALVRRAAIDAAGGFDESLERVEDWDLWLRLSDLGTIATLPEVLADRRLSPLSPRAARDARAEIASRIEPRLEQLPPAEAAPLRARLRADDGIVLAGLGHRREAARTLLGALRHHPRPRIVVTGLAHALAGERAWTAFRHAAAPARRRVTRARRPPRPPGPAPRWAARRSRPAPAPRGATGRSEPRR